MIKIAIENLGWLNKNTITGVLNNWIGDPYRSEPHIRNWRNHYFWDKYGETQLLSLSNLCDGLCDKHKISKQEFQTHFLKQGEEFGYTMLFSKEESFESLQKDQQDKISNKLEMFKI
jgi:hypothetical protein